MEEEDLTFSTLSDPQPANNPSPKRRMQLKTSLLKCNCASSSFEENNYYPPKKEKIGEKSSHI
jgi:hypothetical protein